MTDPDRPPRKPIPLILWVLVGFVLVLGFMIAMRALNPPSAGMGPPIPDVAVPVNPPAAPMPDAKPAS